MGGVNSGSTTAISPHLTTDLATTVQLMARLASRLRQKGALLVDRNQVLHTVGISNCVVEAGDDRGSVRSALMPASRCDGALELLISG